MHIGRVLSSAMHKYITEAMGTCYLALMVGMSINASGHIAPLIIGLSLGTLVLLGGPISGGHFNPAVSLASAIGGTLSFRRAGLYIGAQLAGAAAGGFAADRIFDKHFMPAPGPAGLNAALAAEFLFTFLYVLVALRSSSQLQSFLSRAAAIGAVVAAATHACMSVSGAVFNPALAGAAWCSQPGGPAAMLLYYTGTQCVAASAAAFVASTLLRNESLAR